MKGNCLYIVQEIDKNLLGSSSILCSRAFPVSQKAHEKHLNSFGPEWKRTFIKYHWNTCVNPTISSQHECCGKICYLWGLMLWFKKVKNVSSCEWCLTTGGQYYIWETFCALVPQLCNIMQVISSCCQDVASLNLPWK